MLSVPYLITTLLFFAVAITGVHLLTKFIVRKDSTESWKDLIAVLMALLGCVVVVIFIFVGAQIGAPVNDNHLSVGTEYAVKNIYVQDKDTYLILQDVNNNDLFWYKPGSALDGLTINPGDRISVIQTSSGLKIRKHLIFDYPPRGSHSLYN